ncbi:MAG: hypothetical protein JKY20_11995 [Alphaproteobacteria bacterium]|nr:hypothetical protein [Alphaproteobacteria bacterium]
MEWPKLPDGSVDWMIVFQAPKVGFISLLNEADTTEKLKACFGVIIDSLFTRKGDEDVRLAYHKASGELFADNQTDEHALSGQKLKLRMVMMRVMNDRIHRARLHAEAKTLEAESQGDARQEEKDPNEVMGV